MPEAKDKDGPLRQQLIELLKGGGAHVKFDDVIDGFPEKLRGAQAPGIPHSPWMLLEHLRIAQKDILEFCRDKKHVSPEWPEGYWPNSAAPPNTAAWSNSLKEFRADLKAMQELVKNPKTDLFAKIPWGDGQTILREAMLIADHNAYHLGQVVDLRRLLGVWPEK